MSKLARLLFSFREAARLSKRSISEIVIESLRLRFSAWHLGLSEYFEFRLFRGDLSLAEKLQFGGYKLQAALEELLVDDYSKFLSIGQSLSMYALFKGLRLADSGSPWRLWTAGSSRFCRNLDSIDQLAEHLQLPGSLPVYLKPAFGSYGRGNTLIESTVENGFRLGNGLVISVQELADRLPNPGGLGWLLQEPLESHADIASHCGRKISGIRVTPFDYRWPTNHQGSLEDQCGKSG